jgi:hypothetical protein
VSIDVLQRWIIIWILAAMFGSMCARNVTADTLLATSSPRFGSPDPRTPDSCEWQFVGDNGVYPTEGLIWQVEGVELGDTFTPRLRCTFDGVLSGWSEPSPDAPVTVGLPDAGNDGYCGFAELLAARRWNLAEWRRLVRACWGKCLVKGNRWEECR